MTDYRKIQEDGSAVGLQNVGSLDATNVLIEDSMLTREQSGQVFTVGVDAITVTLPTVTGGLCFEFINSGADGAVGFTIESVGGVMTGTIANAAADSVVSASGAMENTKATANKGDYVRLFCDGTQWFIVGGVGIWAD